MGTLDMGTALPLCPQIATLPALGTSLVSPQGDRGLAVPVPRGHQLCFDLHVLHPKNLLG